MLLADWFYQDKTRLYLYTLESNYNYLKKEIDRNYLSVQTTWNNYLQLMFQVVLIIAIGIPKIFNGVIQIIYKFHRYITLQTKHKIKTSQTQYRIYHHIDSLLDYTMLQKIISTSRNIQSVGITDNSQKNLFLFLI